MQADGKRIGLDISVPDCNWTEEEIKRSMKNIKGNEVPSMLVYVPQELTGIEGLGKLRKMYPKIRDRTFVQDSHDANKKGGWIKVEATVKTPNINATEEELKEHAEKQGYFLQRENVYILASQASKDFTGHYLSEWEWIRLGSCYGIWTNAVRAFFHSDGYLEVHWNLHPQDRVGGRFEEVRKT